MLGEETWLEWARWMQISAVCLFILMMDRTQQHGTLMRNRSDYFNRSGCVFRTSKSRQRRGITQCRCAESVTYNVSFDNGMMTLVIEAGAGVFGLLI